MTLADRIPSDIGQDLMFDEFDGDSVDFTQVPRDRTGARAAALIALYESEIANRPVATCLDWIATELDLSAKLRRFARSLVDAVEEERHRLDGELNRYCRKRTMDEVSPVIRNILRLAVSEMRLQTSTSVAVIVSEAVKLTKMFETNEASRFVNGVLGAFVRDSKRSATGI